MSGFSNKVIEICNFRYKEIYSEYHIKSGKKILISHFGEFSQDFVNSISNTVEDKMVQAGDRKGTIKRIFSILVEGLQNIRIHGEKDNDGNQASFLIIAQDAEQYHLTIGNLILNKNIARVNNKIIEINDLEEADLKAMYMEILTNGIISNKGGAGLGFITMAMKSKNKLNHKFELVNDNLSFFTVEVIIDRIKKE